MPGKDPINQRLTFTLFVMGRAKSWEVEIKDKIEAGQMALGRKRATDGQRHAFYRKRDQHAGYRKYNNYGDADDDHIEAGLGDDAEQPPDDAAEEDFNDDPVVYKTQKPAKNTATTKSATSTLEDRSESPYGRGSERKTKLASPLPPEAVKTRQRRAKKARDIRTRANQRKANRLEKYKEEQAKLKNK
ncbi:MAG: hypothetical protein ACRCWR_00935 [Saezia sp.]